LPDPSFSPDFVLVVVAAWLGATVLARSPRRAGAGLFALLSLAVAIWSAAWIVRRLSTEADVSAIAGSVTAIAGSLLPALLVHLVLVLSRAGRWSKVQQLIVASAYLVAVAFGMASALAADNRAFGPEVVILGVPGPVIDWSWVAFRVVILALAAWWIWASQRGRERVGPQLLTLLGAVVVGAAGGAATIVLDTLGAPPWPGTALMTVAFILAAYATFRSDLFFAPDAARRIASYSVGAAILVAAVAGGAALVDDLARRSLGLDSSLPVAVILVLTLAFFDPARNAFRLIFVPRRQDDDHRRLRQALGLDLLDAGPADRLETVLDELGRSLGGSELALVDASGVRRAGSARIAVEGAQLMVPTVAGGTLLVGPKPAGLPYSRADRELLRQAASFLGASLAMQEVTTTEARALAGLGRRQEALSVEEQQLRVALSEGSAFEKGLEVYTLGSLHAEREGELIRSWGGPKAGTRQAEAIFAFLFDRGDRGALKDEMVELIWPDIDLARADLAFHRTLGGLRRTLSAGGARAGDAISFHNDRYRLNPDMIRWSDLAEFEEHLVSARTVGEPAERLTHLEAARRLYRGDYLDDCPFYGDSSDVEDRRGLLRGRYTDILLALGEAHELRGDRPAAAGFFRDAVQVNGGHCQPAEDGLARLRAAPDPPRPA
jgi:hypothetical protein